MSFKKGYDPNRNLGGKPRRTPDGKSLPAMAREYTEEGLLLCVDIMRDEAVKPEVRLKAIKLLHDRGWGQARQTIDVQGTVQQQHLVATINVDQLTSDAAKQLLAATITSEAIEGVQISLADNSDTAK